MSKEQRCDALFSFLKESPIKRGDARILLQAVEIVLSPSTGASISHDMAITMCRFAFVKDNKDGSVPVEVENFFSFLQKQPIAIEWSLIKAALRILAEVI